MWLILKDDRPLLCLFLTPPPIFPTIFGSKQQALVRNQCFSAEINVPRVEEKHSPGSMVSDRRLTKTLLRLRQAKDQLNKRAIRRFAKNVYMISRLKRQAILCCDDFVTTDQEQYRRFRRHGYIAYDGVRN
jgi:hypothetical protein